MNGAQDLGGMMGFGPVVPEKNEPWFHAPWEARTLAVTLAMGATGTWSLDAMRHARETLPPKDYLSFSYYRIWYHGLVKLLVANGLATAKEIASGKAAGPAKPVRRILEGANVARVLASGGPTNRAVTASPRFKAGDRIRTVNNHPAGHTRLPRYLRGHDGSIVRHHGAHVFPDASAHGGGEDPRHLYTVGFSARELWGEGHRADDFVMADLWEPYLEAV